MSRLPLTALFALLFPIALSAATPEEVVRELNLARTNPQLYATFAEELLPRFQGNLFLRPGRVPVRTKEGRGAVEEAVRFLHRAAPVGPLAVSEGMARAAADHCAAQAGGAVGHGRTGSRLGRYGTWTGLWGENIAYGKNSAREIVLALIIDDGLRHRKHRANIFNPRFAVVGVGYGGHARYGSVCTMDFAGGYAEGATGWRALVARN